MDSRILIFITTTLAVVAAAIIGVAVGTGEYLFPMLAVLAILAVLLIAKPEISVFFTVCLFASHLNAPGLPGQFGLYEIAAMSALLAMVIVVVFKRKIPLNFGIAHWLLFGFCLILFLVGFYRGFGLRFLGSSLWGGYAYIKIFLAAALVLAIPLVNMPATLWRWAILAMGLLSFIPLGADFLSLAGVRLGYINLFVQASGVFSSDFTAELGESVDRITSAGTTAQALLLTLLALVPSRKIFEPRSLWVSIALILILLLSFISGFRLMTASIILVTFIVILLQRALTLNRIVVGTIGCLVALGLVYQVADALPPSMQRAISWLPGVQISQSASIDASATVSWRLELWQEATKSIHDYLWVGRGLAFDGDTVLRSISFGTSSIDWALVIGAFHNGYLSLIILTGLPGLIIGIALIIAVVWRHWRFDTRPWNNPQLLMAHQAFLAMTTSWLIIFLTIYGDIGPVFPMYFFYWAVMEALYKADERESAIGAHSDSPLRRDDYSNLE